MVRPASLSWCGCLWWRADRDIRTCDSIPARSQTLAGWLTPLKYSTHLHPQIREDSKGWGRETAGSWVVDSPPVRYNVISVCVSVVILTSRSLPCVIFLSRAGIRGGNISGVGRNEGKHDTGNFSRRFRLLLG